MWQLERGKDHSLINKVSINDVQRGVYLLWDIIKVKTHISAPEFERQWWTQSSGRTGASLLSVTGSSEDRFSLRFFFFSLVLLVTR